MRFLRTDCLQVFDITILTAFNLQILYDILILFFKHIRKDPILWISGIVIFSVVFNFIYEEQGQYFNTFVEKLTLSFNVRKNCLSDLDSSELFFTYLTNHISGGDFDSIYKLNRIVTPVNCFDDEVISILFHLSGIFI